MKINGSDIGLGWWCSVYLRGALRNNDILEASNFGVTNAFHPFVYVSYLKFCLSPALFKYKSYKRKPVGFGSLDISYINIFMNNPYVRQAFKNNYCKWAHVMLVNLCKFWTKYLSIWKKIYWMYWRSNKNPNQTLVYKIKLKTKSIHIFIYIINWS